MSDYVLLPSLPIDRSSQLACYRLVINHPLTLFHPLFFFLFVRLLACPLGLNLTTELLPIDTQIPLQSMENMDSFFQDSMSELVCTII